MHHKKLMHFNVEFNDDPFQLLLALQQQLTLF